MTLRLTQLTKNLYLALIIALSFSFTGCTVFEEKDESEWTVEEFYYFAKDNFDRGQWESAITYYQKLKSFFPYGIYAEQSFLELAYAYYRNKEPESAKRELAEFIRLYPKHSALPYAYFLKALATDSINHSWLDSWLTDPANRDMKSTQDAFNAYKRLLIRFPDSKYATYSSKRLIVLKNRMARHELLVAQYYYDRHAYLASVNRTKYIVENFPESIVILDSLRLMRDAYNKLGMTRHAQNTQQVIDLNP